MNENLNHLKGFLDDLKGRYLSGHLASTDVDPSIWDFDVRAYCVFAHAAFEQFFEELAAYAVTRIMEQWTSGLLISKVTATSLIAIALYAGERKIKVITDEKDPQDSPLAQISDLLRNNAKELVTRLADNHGASLKYLRTLFIPLGIPVEPGPNASSGLSLLARSRGAYAHKRTPQHLEFATYKPMEPKDALNATDDCFEFCRELANAIPASPPATAYTAEGFLRSARLAEVARAVRKIEERRRADRPAARLPG